MRNHMMTGQLRGSASFPALLLTLLLGGCVGGGEAESEVLLGSDNGSGGNSGFTGAWTGVFNSDDNNVDGTVTALLLGGRLMMLDSEGRIYDGEYSASGPLLEAPSVMRYQPDGTTGTMVNLRRAGLFSGAMEVDYLVGTGAMIYRMHFPGREATAGARQAELAGGWSDGTLQFPVDEGGVVNGADDACQYSGTIRVVQTGVNVYRAAGLGTGTGFQVFGCDERSGTYTGYAALLDGGNVLLVLLSNPSKALHLRLTK